MQTQAMQAMIRFGLGRRDRESQAGGIRALSRLGTHPATYAHLATRLTTHFVVDAPATRRDRQNPPE